MINKTQQLISNIRRALRPDSPWIGVAQDLRRESNGEELYRLMRKNLTHLRLGLVRTMLGEQEIKKQVGLSLEQAYESDKSTRAFKSNWGDVPVIILETGGKDYMWKQRMGMDESSESIYQYAI